MLQTVRTLFMVLAICLLCLPATGFACGSTLSGAQHDCCAQKREQGHWCQKGQAEKQHTGKACNGACSDCCYPHLTEFVMQPLISSLKPASYPHQAVQRWANSEEYSFTDFQLIWTPPKTS